ncbi:hypothetical protein HYT18_04865 [Candidatus Microgenomates bacterium]|nr:hypothetical protein [Candidatus Microgenomates bacterium]
MRSKWFELKPEAIKLRRQGASIREVEKLLKIPRSTLSGWFRNVKLTEKQKNKLKEDWLKALSKARTRAVLWHNEQKQIRLKEAEDQAKKLLSVINLKDKSILELALAMLYLGEGLKVNGTAMGNSNPLILKFFIKALIKLYGFDIKKIKCELHLRADQNPEKLRRYWSEELNLPVSSFTSISIDKRTIGSTTYPSYNGVCVLQCGNIAIQRRLVYLSRLFCEKIAQ